MRETLVFTTGLAIYRDHVSLGERGETSDEGSSGGDVGGVGSGSCR